ncbi:VOC family protein [Cesiribacter andamanensis]|uniref:Putative enzyme n=1 Tax=Cesiribacter andamanensis AMV16 TaxID=1279009 RepID=M7N2D9_9BACT|nr:VOC family protein [Cesiribacter andamanensis]EMR01472.1 putative enzyme [Cesiribacter andamanensis AMV16]
MSQNPTSFQGLRTAIYPVAHVEDAKKWYATAFGVAPYFEEPFYVGFNIGGYELGLVPAEGGSTPGEGGVVVYWGVPDAQLALDYLIGQGARQREGVQDVGGGIRLATVFDPWGNVVGIIENPHFKPERY